MKIQEFTNAPNLFRQSDPDSILGKIKVPKIGLGCLGGITFFLVFLPTKTLKKYSGIRAALSLGLREKKMSVVSSWLGNPIIRNAGL